MHWIAVLIINAIAIFILNCPSISARIHSIIIIVVIASLLSTLVIGYFDYSFFAAGPGEIDFFSISWQPYTLGLLCPLLLAYLISCAARFYVATLGILHTWLQYIVMYIAFCGAVSGMFLLFREGVNVIYVLL